MLTEYEVFALNYAIHSQTEHVGEVYALQKLCKAANVLQRTIQSKYLKQLLLDDLSVFLLLACEAIEGFKLVQLDLQRG